MTITIKTGEKTINNKVKALIKSNINGIAKATKKHVAGIGYVFYFTDKQGNSLGNVCVDGGQAVIRVKQ